MNDARHNVRESQRKWIKRKHKDMFRGSSTQLYVPAFTQKDFHYIVHTGLPTQGTSLRIWANTTSSTPLLSQQIQPLTRGKAQQTQSPLHLEGCHLAKQISTSHLRDKAQSYNSTSSLSGNTTFTITSHQRDLNTITSHQRDITKNGRLQHLVVTKTTNQFFLTKQ